MPTNEQIKILKIKKSYSGSCPQCSNPFIKEIDDGEHIFSLGKRYWVHFCEDDDNLYSRQISFCPYCGIQLPRIIVPILHELPESG